MKKHILTIIVISLFNLLSIAQPPPPQTMASEENQKLIDEIIEITNFKEEYYILCTNFIELKGKEMGWDAAEIEKRKKRMDVDRFIRNNFYNAMAFLSFDELKEIILFLKKINRKRPHNPFLLNSYTIENNLIMHVNSLIE